MLPPKVLHTQVESKSIRYFANRQDVDDYNINMVFPGADLLPLLQENRNFLKFCFCFS